MSSTKSWLSLIVINLITIQFYAEAEEKRIEKFGSGYDRYTSGYDDLRETGDGEIFHVTRNPNGAILSSKKTTIYLGNSCDARSPEFGKGTWGWANGGFLAKFKTKTIGFPRQPDPLNGQRCGF